MDDTEKPVGFADIKAILDQLVSGHDWGDLTFVHGNAFGWADKAALVNDVVHPFSADPPYRLIDPALVGVGRAKETNIYIALTVGIAGFARMPFGGPYATDAQIATIAAWIDAGMPD